MTKLMVVGALILASLLFTRLAMAQTRSIWDGVYTAAQGVRGQTAYTQHCARCHGYDLDGGDEVTALDGGHFMADFDSQSVADLARRIQVTMPMETPGALGIATVTDITAFLLQQNGVPAGPRELPPDLAAQSLIHFDAVKK